MFEQLDERQARISIAGYFVASVARAFLHLRMLGGEDVEELLAGVEPMGQYGYSRFVALLTTVGKRFRDMEPVLEELGIQLMTDWYNQGPGKQQVSTGVGFLKFQTGSEGYRSVVSGPPEVTGEFVLEAIDEEAGTARVRSTTPFPKTMERGVLIGGMKAPGDLAYVDVENASDPLAYNITFR